MKNVKCTIRELLDAGVHFGHRKNYWNPKMAPYLYGIRNGIHIIDLQQTFILLHRALNKLREVAASNGRVLFVGTKAQASEIVEDYSKRCGQYYVQHRWLGGMLTNWRTVSASIKTLSDYEKTLEDEKSLLVKKERLELERKREKLHKVLGGIRKMGGSPDLLFVIDTRQESLAILEANKLGIPVIAIVDSNASAEGVDYVIPGNDDARKSIELYMRLAAQAVLEGIEEEMGSRKTSKPKAEAANLESKDITLVEVSEFEGDAEENEDAPKKVAEKKAPTKPAAKPKTAKSA
jgi:small subunit ribosomal protein S2